MRGKRDLDAFKIEAIKQIANRDHSISNATWAALAADLAKGLKTDAELTDHLG
ncbi:hypothetical protein H5A43_02785, partial [Pectobacterium brasiliense]|nr:hypothetical protein [Pectobacterium brasiliense]